MFRRNRVKLFLVYKYRQLAGVESTVETGSKRSPNKLACNSRNSNARTNYIKYDNFLEPFYKRTQCRDHAPWCL